MAPEEDRVSTGELGRRIDRGFADIKDDIRDLAGRIETKVDLRTYESLVARVAQIETDRRTEANRRAEERRSIAQGLIYPIIVAVVLSIGAVVAAMYVALAKG